MAEDADEIAALKARLAQLERMPPPRAKSGAGALGGGCLIAVLLLVVLIFAASKLPSPPESAADKAAREQEGADFSLMVAAKQGIKDSLRDPASAVFEDVQVGHKSGKAVVCGYYNARNGFGGYVGREPFMSTSERVMTPRSIGRRAFVRMWNSSCPTV